MKSIGFFLAMISIWTLMSTILLADAPKLDFSFSANDLGLTLSVVLLLGIAGFYWVIAGVAYFANYLSNRIDNSVIAMLILLGSTVLIGIFVAYFDTQGRAIVAGRDSFSLLVPLALVVLAYGARTLFSRRY
jgi:uncharacterized membrane protein HdeD (DUF308 family)